jgi:TonB family protein
MVLRTAAALITLAITASPLIAQSVVAGAAVDAGTGEPLPCLGVALTDSAARVVAATTTDAQGLFEFAAAPAGARAVRFRAFGRRPMEVPVSPTATADTLRQYRLVFADSAPLGSDAPEDGASAGFGTDVEPVRLLRPPMRYPAGAQQRRSEGAVVVQFVIGPDGWVVRPSRRVLASPDAALSGAVLDHVARLRFRPARRGGAPACALARESYKFTLGY